MVGEGGNDLQQNNENNQGAEADVSNGQLRTFDDRLRTRWIRSGPKKRKRRADVDVLEIDDDLDELINEQIGV